MDDLIWMYWKGAVYIYQLYYFLKKIFVKGIIGRGEISEIIFTLATFMNLAKSFFLYRASLLVAIFFFEVILNQEKSG